MRIFAFPCTFRICRHVMWPNLEELASEKNLKKIIGHVSIAYHLNPKPRFVWRTFFSKMRHPNNDTSASSSPSSTFAGYSALVERNPSDKEDDPPTLTTDSAQGCHLKKARPLMPKKKVKFCPGPKNLKKSTKIFEKFTFSFAFI